MVKIAKVWALLGCGLLAWPCLAFAQHGGEVAVPLRVSVAAESSAWPAAAAPQTSAIHYDTRQGDFELGMGFSYLRFYSSPFHANTYGMTTNATYFVRSWMGVEGNISSGFVGSQSASSVGARSVLYGSGIRVVSPRTHPVRPWAHAVIGGIHMFPQTAFSNNGFAVQLGGGADLPLRPWLWLRMEANYVRSQLYTEGQNNLQIATGIVYRF
jgi:hypothetical protein